MMKSDISVVCHRKILRHESLGWGTRIAASWVGVLVLGWRTCFVLSSEGNCTIFSMDYTHWIVYMLSASYFHK